MNQAVGVFVDVSNIYANVGKKFPGRRLNYATYLLRAQSYGSLYRAVAYGLEQGEEAGGFKVALRHLGYETKYKRLASGQPDDVKRCSWNVGMAMDVVRLIDKLDVVVLGSNDTGLSDLAAFVKERGRKCIVIACNIQRELKDTCNQYVEVKDDMVEVKT